MHECEDFAYHLLIEISESHTDNIDSCLEVILILSVHASEKEFVGHRLCDESWADVEVFKEFKDHFLWHFSKLALVKVSPDLMLEVNLVNIEKNFSHRHHKDIN